MLSRAVEHAEMKDAAAQLTHLSDERLIAVLETLGRNVSAFSGTPSLAEKFPWFRPVDPLEPAIPGSIAITYPPRPRASLHPRVCSRHSSSSLVDHLPDSFRPGSDLLVVGASPQAYVPKSAVSRHSAGRSSVSAATQRR